MSPYQSLWQFEAIRWPKPLHLGNCKNEGYRALLDYVEALYIARLGVADSAQEFILHGQDVTHQGVGLLRVGTWNVEFVDQTLGEEFTCDIVHAFLQCFSTCHNLSF